MRCKTHDRPLEVDVANKRMFCRPCEEERASPFLAQFRTVQPLVQPLVRPVKP